MSEKIDRRETSCFTYEVKMVVQILAVNREEADEKLEREGGFVSRREVVFKDYISVYSGEPEEVKEAE